MTQLIYGTGNPAKLDHMRKMLAPLNLNFIGAKETGVALPDVDESGNTPLENARIKALAYYKVLKRPVFACDSGLYIDGLPDSEQPGVHVRMVSCKRLTDDEMVAHYSAIARRLDGKASARYRNAICLVMGDGEIYEHFGEDIASGAFHIVDIPHTKRVEGFPLDSLSARIESGKYYYDEAEARSDSDNGMTHGFQAFFRRVLALYEKTPQSFRDYKVHIDTPAVREILAACVFDSSPEGMAYKISKYQANPDMLFYGYQVNGELVGVCGFEEHESRVEIYHIAARESARGKGVGSAMITALQEKYRKAIEAETDDDAVGFYRKCGFETTAIQKYNVRRWVCVLPAPQVTRKAKEGIKI